MSDTATLTNRDIAEAAGLVVHPYYLWAYIKDDDGKMGTIPDYLNDEPAALTLVAITEYLKVEYQVHMGWRVRVDYMADEADWHTADTLAEAISSAFMAWAAQQGGEADG